MSDNKPRKIRTGSFNLKLTDEALKYQVENYNKLNIFSSARGKAGLAYMIIYTLGSWLGAAQYNLNHNTWYAILFLGALLAVIIYNWPKIGITIAFAGFSLNAIFVIISQPTAILGAFIPLFILAYVLCPAYQVENKIKALSTNSPKAKI